jgi:hypothetical protein
MTHTVTLSNGDSVDFPDEMGDDAIAQALKGYPGASDVAIPPPELPGAHGARVLGSNLIGGALNLAGLPGTIGKAIPQLSPEEGGGEGLGGLLQNLPTGADLNAGAKRLGLVDQPNQQPQGTGEQMLAAVGQGVGGTAPLGLLNAPAAIPAALGKAGLQGAFSGAGGELARMLTPSHLSSPASTLAGVLAGQALGGGVFGAAGRTANAMRGVGNPVVQAYDTAGVTPRLAGDVTGNPLLQGLQSTAMRLPFGGRAVRAAQEGAQEFGNAIEDTAAPLGSSRSLQEAGTALQNEGTAWLGNFKADSKKAWDAVDTQIPASTPTPVLNYARTLMAVRNQMPGAPATAKVLQPALSSNLLDSLVSDITKGPLTWQDVKGIRSRIGEKLEDPVSIGPADTSYADLKRIYGALSGDLQSAAAARGPAAQTAFNNASTLTKNGHDFIESTLSNINGDKIAPEQAANRALNSGTAGGTFLQAIRDQMPIAANELAAFKLRDMAAATPGRATADMPTSAMTFSTNLNRLSPEARQALFAGIAPKLSALQTVAEQGKETFARYGNPSGTSGASEHANLFRIPTAIGAGVAGGYEAGGIPGAAIGGGLAAAPAFAGPTLSNLTARESLARYLAAPVGGPGVGASRLYRAAAGGEALQSGERGR